MADPGGGSRGLENFIKIKIKITHFEVGSKFNGRTPFQSFLDAPLKKYQTRFLQLPALIRRLVISVPE